MFSKPQLMIIMIITMMVMILIIIMTMTMMTMQQVVSESVRNGGLKTGGSHDKNFANPSSTSFIDYHHGDFYIIAAVCLSLIKK